MEKLEVGEYIKLKDGLIGQFYNIEEGYDGNIIVNFEEFAYEYEDVKQFYEDIVKHSKNLIDLIEIGDIVNGYRILEMVNSIYKKSKWILIYKNEREKYERWIYIKEYDGKIHTQDDIKTILTKEQYMQNCYKVKEK